MWDALKAVLRENFIPLNVYIGKEKRSKICLLSFLLSKWEKQVNEMQSKLKKIKSVKLNTRNNEKKLIIWKDKKIDKDLAQLKKQKLENTDCHINEKLDFSINTHTHTHTHTHRGTVFKEGDNYKQLCVNKLQKFNEYISWRQKLHKVNQYKREYLNSSISVYLKDKL